MEGPPSPEDVPVHNISPPPPHGHHPAGAPPPPQQLQAQGQPAQMDVEYANQAPVSVEDCASLSLPLGLAPPRSLSTSARGLTLALSRCAADEAFAAKHLSDMGEEVDDFQVFRWPLKDYRRMDKKTLSPEFSCGGHKWCVPRSLLAFPSSRSLRLGARRRGVADEAEH